MILKFSDAVYFMVPIPVSVEYNGSLIVLVCKFYALVRRDICMLPVYYNNEIGPDLELFIIHNSVLISLLGGVH